MSNKAKLKKPLHKLSEADAVPYRVIDQGSYDEVITSVNRYALSRGRTIVVGDIDTEAGFEDDDGFLEYSYLEIELVCPHGNATDSYTYTSRTIQGQHAIWRGDEVGTDAFFDNCRCQGVT